MGDEVESTTTADAVATTATTTRTTGAPTTATTTESTTTTPEPPTTTAESAIEPRTSHVYGGPGPRDSLEAVTWTWSDDDLCVGSYDPGPDGGRVPWAVWVGGDGEKQRERRFDGWVATTSMERAPFRTAR